MLRFSQISLHSLFDYNLLASEWKCQITVMSSQSRDSDVHPGFKISPRSHHLACLLSRAILDFTRTFSRDDSRFQNIPNIFYGQDPFRSIVKSFHEIYCKAASHTIQCEGEKTAWVRLMVVIYRPSRDPLRLRALTFC